MLRAVWSDSGLEIVDQEPGPLESGWVRLQVEACGICGSDLHFWHRELPPPLGTSPGHELVGTVVDGPAGLPDVRYAVSPNVTCGKCSFCLSGRSNLCGRAGAGIGLGRNGGLAELVDAPVENLAPIPDGRRPGRGVVDRAARRHRSGHRSWRGSSADSKVLVLGAGAIGLCAALVARDRAADVAITARHPHQQEAAGRLGVTVLREDEAIAWGKEHRPDVVVESVGGAAGTMTDAVRVVARGGRIVILGTFSRPMPVNLQRADDEGGRAPRVVLLRRAASGSRSSRPRLVSPVAGTTNSTSSRHTSSHSTTSCSAFDAASDKTTGAIKVTLTP